MPDPAAPRSETFERHIDADAREVEISFQPYLDALWESRRIMGAVTLAITLVFALVLLGMWVWKPSESLSTLRFRLLFEGADEGKFPNDAPFSPAEIVAAPVVAQVYEANDLQRYGGLGDFKSSLHIQRASAQLDMLAYDYQARLADTGLSAVDRARIEDEFRSRAQTVKDPSYSINLRRSERFTELPSSLAQKVLSDLLNTWAEHAQSLKGVLRYQVAIFPRNILTPESLAVTDYLVAADRLRTEAKRVAATADQVAEMPGAIPARTTKNGSSVAEIKARLDDVIRFTLVPLIATISAEGASSDPRQLGQYASSMLWQLQLEKQTAEARAQALQQSLRNYAALNAPRFIDAPSAGANPSAAAGPSVASPQVTDSFVDRIQEMAAVTQDGEMAYRRTITNRLIGEMHEVAAYDRELRFYQELANPGARPLRAPSPERDVQLRHQIETAFDVVARATVDLHDLYQQLSTMNLNPAGRLFELTGGFTRETHWSLSSMRIAALYLLVLLFTLLVVPLLLLLRAAIARRSAWLAALRGRA